MFFPYCFSESVGIIRLALLHFSKGDRFRKVFINSRQIRQPS